ncbi:MAG: aminomethyl transferase family protein [Deltaproteobacteria bacterium]|nr:MAG: aminomethyl transferase family protein [Deltaproteobacteria bacterium]
MPQPTPFHPRTHARCSSYAWKHWAGYYAVCHYDESPEREYSALRAGAGLLDVTPLYKYDVSGADAGAFLDFVLSKPVSALKQDRVTYLCWTDDDGRIIDDGTCWRLGERRWRLTSASPSLFWLARHAVTFGDVHLADVSHRVAALALQGPTSREVLAQICDADLDRLRFFGLTTAAFEPGFHGTITRTGYTGDLGYEIWVDNAHALHLWDALMERGKHRGIWPIGLDVLDIARIEAGFVLQGCDYHSVFDAAIPAQTSSPLELGLGWTVKLDRDPFIGQAALTREREQGSAWAFVGLDIDWEETEKLYAAHDLPPALPTAAWRTPVPVYRGARQVGRATSGAWSPILKKNLALASVMAEVAAPGTVIDIEVTVEWARCRVPATVTPLPFFDPPRKRA